MTFKLIARVIKENQLKKRNFWSKNHRVKYINLDHSSLFFIQVKHTQGTQD
jgi:hypothetical protein